MALGRQRVVTRNQNSVSFRTQDKRLGPVVNSIVLIVLACLLGLLYLTQVTKTNTYGYAIHDLQRQQTNLASEHDDLLAASARLQSINRAQASAEAKSLVATVPAGSVQ